MVILALVLALAVPATATGQGAPFRPLDPAAPPPAPTPRAIARPAFSPIAAGSSAAAMMVIKSPGSIMGTKAPLC